MLSKEVKTRIAKNKIARRHPKKRWAALRARHAMRALAKANRNAVFGKFAVPAGTSGNAHYQASFVMALAQKKADEQADLRYYKRERISKKYEKPRALLEVVQELQLNKPTPEQQRRWLETLPAERANQKALGYENLKSTLGQ